MFGRMFVGVGCQGIEEVLQLMLVAVLVTVLRLLLQNKTTIFAVIYNNFYVCNDCYVCNSLCLTYRFGRIAHCHSRRPTLLGSWSAAPVALFYVLRPWPKSDRPHNVPQHMDASGAES